MRKLTEKELDQVNKRLKIIPFLYGEICDEIKDHYLSELEKKPSDEFQDALLQLNKAFNRSVVERMEENLKRSTERAITQMQWDKLKFWKLPNYNILYLFLLLITLGVVYLYLDVEGMTLMVGIFSLVCIPIIWFSIWKDISFSLMQFRVNSAKAFSYQIMTRSGIYFYSLYFFCVTYTNWNDSNPGVFGTVVIWLIDIPLLLYMLTLVQVALDWKQKQLHILTR